MTISARRAAYAMVVTPLLALGACSGSTAPTAPTQAGGAGSAATGSTAKPSAASPSASPNGSGGAGSTSAAGAGGGAVTVTVPADPCAVLPISDQSLFTEIRPAKTKLAPPAGCIYLDAADQVIFVYRLSTKQELPGGLESLQNSATSRMVGPVTKISIRGFDGFQAAGKGTGTPEALIGVQVGPDYILECNAVRPGIEVSTALGICQDATAALLDKLAKKS